MKGTVLYIQKSLTHNFFVVSIFCFLHQADSGSLLKIRDAIFSYERQIFKEATVNYLEEKFTK